MIRCFFFLFFLKIKAWKCCLFLVLKATVERLFQYSKLWFCDAPTANDTIISTSRNLVKRYQEFAIHPWYYDVPLRRWRVSRCILCIAIFHVGQPYLKDNWLLILAPHLLCVFPHRVGWPPSWCQATSSTSSEPEWTVCSVPDTCAGGSCESRRMEIVWRQNKSTADESSGSLSVLTRCSIWGKGSVCLYLCSCSSRVVCDFTVVPSVKVCIKACVTSWK